MKTLMGLVAALSLPLMVLNVLGGIVSGIWLAVLRDWGAIGLGVGLFLVSTLVLGIAIMPSLLLAAPAAMFAERGKTVGVLFFSTLSSLYILALITVWCCVIFFVFVKGATAANYIPRLIWSYGAATGPWAYMASQDQASGYVLRLPHVSADLTASCIEVGWCKFRFRHQFSASGSSAE